MIPELLPLASTLSIFPAGLFLEAAGWARLGHSLGKNRVSVWSPWKGVIWEGRFPWACWNGMLVGGPEFRETEGLKAGEGVLRGYPVQSGMSMFLNPQALPVVPSGSHYISCCCSHSSQTLEL